MSTSTAPAPAIPVDASLHERVFEMVSSTASVVDPHSPSRFAYYEEDGVIWGAYEGDTVVVGRFVGHRAGDTLAINFVHRGVDGGVTAGEGRSVISIAPDGALVLTEDFEGPNGTPEVSVCREVRA